MARRDAGCIGIANVAQTHDDDTTMTRSVIIHSDDRLTAIVWIRDRTSIARNHHFQSKGHDMKTSTTHCKPLTATPLESAFEIGYRVPPNDKPKIDSFLRWYYSKAKWHWVDHEHDTYPHLIASKQIQNLTHAFLAGHATKPDEVSPGHIVHRD